MNDNFMTPYQPQVRLAFEKDLRTTLRTHARRQQRRTRAAITVSVFMLLLGTVFSIPPLRAQVQWLVHEIGGMTFVETENPIEDRPAIREAFATPIIESSPSDYCGEYLIEELVTDFPYVLDAPCWQPDGYQQDEHVTVQGGVHNLYVITQWHNAACITCNTYITFEAEPLAGQYPAAMPVPENITSTDIQALSIRNTTAALVYFASPATTDDVAWLLIWQELQEEGLFEYRLSSNDPHITHDEIVRMLHSTGFGKALSQIDPERADAWIEVNLTDLLMSYPIVADFLPTWEPDGFTKDHIGISINSSQGTIIWRPDAADLYDYSSPYPWIGLSIGKPWDDPYVVESGMLEEVIIGDYIPAALQRVAHLENPKHDPEGRIYILDWHQNGLRYSISWREPGLTHEDIFRMAASVPHAQFPIDADDLDELLHLFLIEE